VITPDTFDLSSLKAGDTILLASGTYPPLAMKNPPPNLTIQAAPHAKPVFPGMDIRQADGMVLHGLSIDLSGGGVARISNSSGVAFLRGEVFGAGTESTVWPVGLTIQGGSGNIVRGCEFHHLFYGLQHDTTDGLKVQSNKFHDIRVDGVRGGGSSDLLIDANEFWDFYRVGPAWKGGPQDHADCVQVWATNTTKRAVGIRITRNKMRRGQGTGMDGIMMRITDPELYPDKVVISDNEMVGLSTDSIAIAGLLELNLSGNKVSSLPPGGLSNVYTNAQIRIGNVAKLTLQGNQCEAFSLDGKPATPAGVTIVKGPYQ
jgi:hypothetical protein